MKNLTDSDMNCRDTGIGSEFIPGGEITAARTPSAESAPPDPSPAALALHIEPVESYRLPREYPWSVLAFAVALPLFAMGIVGATAYWSDVLVVALLLAAIATLIGGLRLAARQETRRNALAREAYAALPPALLVQATMSAELSERTRTIIANLLTRHDANWAHDLDSNDAEWAGLKQAGPPRCGGCRGPVPPKGGFTVRTIPPQ